MQTASRLACATPLRFQAGKLLRAKGRACLFPEAQNPELAMALLLAKQQNLHRTKCQCAAGAA